MNRYLKVYLDKERVGTLSEENDIWGFTYHSDWLTSPNSIPLTPHIPLIADKQIDGSTKRHIQWFFDNLLPEEKARELLSKDLKIDKEDAFGLLAASGRESAGALTLVLPEEALSIGQVHPLSRDEINARILQLPTIPLNHKERKRMSVAGAQHKMLVVYQKTEFYEPEGQMPSSHILKPEHSSPEIYYFTPRNEWFVMKLAKRVGLDVPAVYIEYLPAPVYIIERFDRKGIYPNQNRIHVLDGCQILGISPYAKYRQSKVESLRELSELCQTRAKAKLDIFKWACFNAIVGNGDAHLKNLSFFMTDKAINLAPHYDLLSTKIYERTGEHQYSELSQPMGEATTLEQLTQQNVYLFGEQLGIPQPLAKRELNKLLKIIPVESDKLYQQVEALPAYEGKGGELRMLREIQINCIQEMVDRLSH